MTYFLLYLALGFILTYVSIYVKRKDEKKEAQRQEILALVENAAFITNAIAFFILALISPILYSLKLILPKTETK